MIQVNEFVEKATGRRLVISRYTGDAGLTIRDTEDTTRGVKVTVGSCSFYLYEEDLAAAIAALQVAYNHPQYYNRGHNE